MSETTDTPRIQAILASGIKIPPLPEVLLKVQAMLRDPDVSTSDLARLIRQDGALSGAVFRVVGSPVFGLRARVDTVDRAVALLGIPPTLAILRGIALRAALGGGHDAALEALWQRSGRIAQFAMLAARLLRLRGISPDQAYTLGMFHDCGLALLVKRFAAYDEALARGRWAGIPALDHAQNSDHGLLGEMVARNWQLPEVVARAIRHHHDLEGGGQEEAVARLVALLNIACHMHSQALGEEAPEWEAGWKQACLVRLGLTGPDLVGLEVDVGAAMARA